MHPHGSLGNARGDSVAGTPAPAASLVALTMGDPAGIGPDLALMAWVRRSSAQIPAFVTIGDPLLFERRAKALDLDVPVQVVTSADEAASCFASALPVLSVTLPVEIDAGKPDPASATAVIAAIEQAVELVRHGDAAALVTNPVNKALLYQGGFRHAGHTEFLGELAEAEGADATPVMMLVCDEFRTVPATVHVPLAKVPGMLSRELIAKTIMVTAGALKGWFRISTPRIAVTGLNPHAGEDGTIGNEEIEIIGPAIEEARTAGIDVTGPHPADAIFQERLRGSYDAVVTMYHDQALIPVKTIAFDRAVNTTLGLPFVRTSPDHGTAYALAGTGQANPSSLIAALELAWRLVASQKVDA